MKNIGILLIFFHVLLASCTKNEDIYLVNKCASDCVLLQGRTYNMFDSSLVKNVNYSIKFYQGFSLWPSNTTITSGKTDNNGYYFTNFSGKDLVDRNDLLNISFTHPEYLFVKNHSVSNKTIYLSKDSLDILKTVDIYLLPKSYLKVVINNYSSNPRIDSISYGFEHKYGKGGPGNIVYSEQDKAGRHYAIPANEPITMYYTYKKKYVGPIAEQVTLQPMQNRKDTLVYLLSVN